MKQSSGHPERSRYHHGDLRQSLIDAAIAIIESGDLAQLSLREVARRVGVSHNAPYRHFSDKDALLSAVAEQGFQKLRQATEQASNETVNADQRLRAIGTAYVQFALNNPVYYRVMFSLYQGRQDEGLKTAMAQTFAVLLSAIQQGQQTGVFRTGDPLSMAQVAWASVHGIAMLIIDGQLTLNQATPLEEFLQISFMLLTEGLLQSASPRPSEM